MDAAVTIDTFGKLLQQDEQDDSVLLRTLRDLKSVVMSKPVPGPVPTGTEMAWTGWS